jgi:asparagine synthase (glutamine-hydrolysing)
MCGFVFFYKDGEDSQGLSEIVNRSLKRLSHRGPDDEGVWCDPPCVVGHRRLAIIDIAGSRQPMIDPSKRFVIAYNGEVFNFRELHKGLEEKWDFQTKGDTEVVLAGLIIHGDSFLRRMEGMWALALWDTQNRTLLLARDRMGKKPLYYEQGKGEFACASELPALAIVSGSVWQEDINSTADYLRYGYYLPGRTAYQGVHEVLPGNVLKWSPRNGVDQRAYWSLTIGGFSGSKQQAHAALRETFTKAVKRRLVADVEVGAFLSGGIDSSLIVSVLSRELGVKLKTFTIGFPEASYDERRYARLMARLCASEHYEKSFQDWDRERLISILLNHCGQPFSDVSLLPTAMVSEFAASRVKVALSGDGGDELFSGYQRYQARAMLRWYTRLPDIIKRNVKRSVRAIPEPMSHHSHSILKKAHLFLDIVDRQESETPYIAPVLYAPEQFRQLAPELDGMGDTPPGLPEESEEDSLTEMMAADALIYLPQDILVKVDRASMAYSLETRAPFLDGDMVKLAFSLPRRWHRRGFTGKRMFRESFLDLLPRLLWRRRKQGFVVPIHHWFRHGLSAQLMELEAQLSTPLNASFIKQMVHEHCNGRRDHGYRLWNIYAYLLWLHHRPWRLS